MLGTIQRLVRTLDEHAQVITVNTPAHANAERDAKPLGTDSKRRGLQRLTQPLRKRKRKRGASSAHLDDGGELFASVAIERGRGAQTAFQPLRHAKQDLVAGRVAEAVVDLLEEVDIAQQDRDLPVFRQRSCVVRIEYQAIEQSG